MSSGRVQLAAVGIQDQFLTGNPDVSYFIKKFNRHTKFALEILDTTFFQTNIDFGSWVNTVIPRNGQLIRTIYVRLVLPALSVGGYTNGIGNAIIEHADLVIGGQTIERITGEYMQIFDQTFISDSQQASLTYMVGTTNDGLYGLGPATAYGNGLATPAYGWYPRTFIVPLPFYFIRNEALSIPLCALTRQEVEVRIKFRPIEQLIAGGYISSEVTTTSSIVWTDPTVSGIVAGDLPLSKVTWLPQSFSFACISEASAGNTSNIYYFNYGNDSFDNLSNLSPSNLGTISCISQNNAGVTIVLSERLGSNNVTISNNGIFGKFNAANAFNTLAYQYGFSNVATDGTNFLAIASDFIGNSLVSFTSPNFISTPEYFTANPYVSITWSPTLSAFLIGDSSGVMHSYQIGDGFVKQLVNVTGPYSAYSPTYGQIYNNSQVVASNTVISNIYSSSFDAGYTWTTPLVVNPAPPFNTGVPFGTTSIAYGSGFDLFFTLQPGAGTYYLGTPQSTSTLTAPTPLTAFQASLPVEYVFLGDEEVQYIQGAKVDYVITQLQRASVQIPANISSLNGYRLYFINPVKEMFFTIQDSNVLATNDYWNYYNTSTGEQQLVDLDLQFNGEDMISSTVADALYLGRVQFLNNHTRLPNLAIYNYSFAIDPENYVPTGQVNMSRIMNQNLWLNLTPNPNSRTVNIYAKAYNILRVQNGLAGVLFMDNNFI
jgi:hypothetical protein